MTASGSSRPANPAPAAAAPTDPNRAAPASASGRGKKLRARLRVWRLWIILSLVLCLVLLLGVLSGTAPDEAALSPTNPAPAGALAAATILGEQGVDVSAPQSFQEALALLEGNGAESTLLLFDPNGFLSPDQLADLDGLARRQVLVEPSFTQLSALAPAVRPAGVLPAEATALDARCAVPDAGAAETIDAGGYAYRAPVICFPAPGGGTGSGSYAADPGAGAVVLGNAALLANDSLAHRGNAALTLRTLGSTETLVWYLPTIADVPAAAAPGDPRELLPDWVDPLLLWLLVVAVLAMLWRGRRLGPLAAETMPVVVRSAETAQGRARLYQDGRATGRAAATLRAATLTRLAAKLRLGPGSAPALVVQAAAAATARPVREIERLLTGPLPAGDAALVQWSQDLQALEEEVTAS